MTNWLSMTSAPRNGYTHILILYERHAPNTFVQTPSGKWKSSMPPDAGMAVNQALYNRETKQWRLFYQPVMFEPVSPVLNEQDVLAWMPLPVVPAGSGIKMHRKQRAYVKRRDARWRKEGILKS